MPDEIYWLVLCSNDRLLLSITKTRVGQSPMCSIERKLLSLPEIAITEDLGGVEDLLIPVSQDHNSLAAR